MNTLRLASYCVVWPVLRTGVVVSTSEDGLWRPETTGRD